MEREPFRVDDLLVAQLGGIIGNLVRNLVGYLPTAFASWPWGVERLKELMAERGLEDPSMELMFDVIEENPELTIASIDQAFWDLPLSVRLSINGAIGIAQGILKVKSQWAKELVEGRERIILVALKNPKDPLYIELAQNLEKHPRTLKALTAWILNKLGLPYIEGEAIKEVEEHPQAQGP